MPDLPQWASGSPMGGGSVAAIAFGTAAAQPAASASNRNTGFFATDTREITFSDGAAWWPVGFTSNQTFRVGSAGGPRMGLNLLGGAQALEPYPGFTITPFGTSYLFASGGVSPNSAGTLYSGTGAPAAGLGANGDWYMRTDTPGTVNQRLYVKVAGAWTGIL